VRSNGILADTAVASDFSSFRSCLPSFALLVRYAHVSIPIVSAHSFETLLIGFLLLLAGNLFRGF
jgi:hypothetical protein